MSAGAPGGLTLDTPGQTARVAEILAKRAAAKQNTEPEEADNPRIAEVPAKNDAAEAESSSWAPTRRVRSPTRSGRAWSSCGICGCAPTPGRAWIALDYASWSDYCTAEFGTERVRIPREERTAVVGFLRDAGLPQRAIADATGLGLGTVNRELAPTITEPVSVPNGTSTGVEPVEPEPVVVETQPEPASVPNGTSTDDAEPEPVDDDDAGEPVLNCFELNFWADDDVPLGYARLLVDTDARPRGGQRHHRLR